MTMRAPLLTLPFLVLLAPPAFAQIPGQNPDWPCAQRLVETLSPGAYWNGPVTPDPNWRNDQAVFDLVTDIVDRDTQEADAVAKLTTYAATLPPEARAKRLPALFAALVEQTNDQRTPLIQRLEQLGRRQRGMGETIAAISNRIDATPAADPHRDDLVGERDFDVRAFQQTQHTMRYACEAPPAMERRLGAFARVLQAVK
jgi:hypothetical protein